MRMHFHHDKDHPRHCLLWLILAILLLSGYCLLVIRQKPAPIAPIKALSTLTYGNQASALAWPSSGETAVGLEGNGVIATHGPQTPVPIASTAKLLTALSVLRKDPLSIGQQGPTITLGPSDVAIYTAYAARDGSVVPVVAGEQISEYQMIEAMLLPSANNMADSLAIWAFGSLPAYAAYANQYASQLGLTQTHIGEDASGFDPSTTSTAANLVQLGEITLENPVLAHIVAQSSASGFPVVSVIKNVNSVLGTDSIIGIKTGNTAQAGGVFISASDTTVSGLAVTVITAYVGAPSLYDAMYGSLPLIVSAQDNFSPVTIAADAIVGSYRLPWGGFVQVATKSGLVIAHWKGSPITAQVRLEPIAFDSRAGSVAGALISEKSGLANSQTIPLVLTKTTTGPTDMWKLLHPEKVRWSLP